MTIELLRTLSISMFVGAAIFLVISIVLYFVLDIPKLYGEISGKTAKKAIAEIKRKSQSSSGYATKVKKTKNESQMTAKMGDSGSSYPITEQLEGTTDTEKLSYETTILQNEETTVLHNEEKTNINSEETTVLTSYEYQQKNECNMTLDVQFSFFSSEEFIE